MITMFGPFMPVIYQTLLLGPGVVVVACTACRVHRIMVSAYHDPEGGDILNLPALTNIRFAQTHSVTENTLSRRPRVENLAGTMMNNSSGSIGVKDEGKV